MPENSPSPRQSAWIVLAMLAMVAIPAGITLHTIRVAGIPQDFNSNPTPHGYTWSLLLFVIPILVIGIWFLPNEGVRISQRAFWRTIGILVPFGFTLDFFFANRFFEYPNTGATLGVPAPALGGSVPIEEYIFYFTGFIAILLIYVWLDEYWLAAYKVADYPGEAKQIRRLLQFHPYSLMAGLALIAVAILYKKLRSPFPEGSVSISLRRARPGPFTKTDWKSSVGENVSFFREPDAGKPPVRFGGRGDANQCVFPTSIEQSKSSLRAKH